MKEFTIPNLGKFDSSSGFIERLKCSDGIFEVGINGVKGIYATGDQKVEFICFENDTLCYVLSSIGHPAYYPVKPVKILKPIKAVLMDLDGTSVRSEEFWIWIIQSTISRLIKKPLFELEKSDLPHVSGHSVSEHLQYCIQKYSPSSSLEEARKIYFDITRYEMNEIMEGRGKQNAFAPSNGLKEFLTGLKERNIKIGLVTSGLYEKAWPEILSAFQTLDMGNPKDFYDSSISAGFPLGKGQVGTLGELCPKPHPWLYAETATVGLNILEDQRAHVIGIEDSGAGVCSIRLAGFGVIGYDGGNIKQSGTQGLCNRFESTFEDILKFIDEK